MLTIKRIMKNKRKEKRSCRLILACCALLLFISVNAFAQQQVTVTGNVKDEKGEPIIGQPTWKEIDCKLYHFEKSTSLGKDLNGSPITTNATLEKDGKTYVIDENGVATEKVN